MTFEDQLATAFETLTQRLRGEIDQEVERRTAEKATELDQEVQRRTAEMATGIDEEVQRRTSEKATELDQEIQRKTAAMAIEIDEEVQRRTAEKTARLDQEVERRAVVMAAEIAAAAPPPVVPDPEPIAYDASSAARLTAAVRSMDEARSLTGILDALLGAARAEAGTADVWLSRDGQMHQWRSSESGHAAHDSPRGSLVVPIAIAGSDVAFVYADVEESGTADVEQRTTNVELLTRYAARSLEALTAFTAARALTRRPDAPAARPDEDADAEEDTSARRYARLLVSEIKLYHEPAVNDGRRDRDLLSRLGGEITRARVMYEQRVPPLVRERGDYFHDELVRTLCDGDASLLEVRS